jgi:hypothetical protein
MSIDAGQCAKKNETKRDHFLSRKAKGGYTRAASNNTPVEQILHLQRSIGNRAVTRLIQSGAIQAKLTIGKPNDIYEQEADRVADQVMRMSEESLVSSHLTLGRKEDEFAQAKPMAEQITPLVQRQVDEEEEPMQTKLIQCQVEEEEEIQAKQAGNRAPAVSPNIESSINSLRGGGQPLSESTRSFFEPRFGTDFSHVRVHHDSHAANTARAVNAKAFTTGKDIVFGPGQYSPEIDSGNHLLAHELTHVVQQGGSKVNSFSQPYIQRKKKKKKRTVEKHHISIKRDTEIGDKNCCKENQNHCCTLGTAEIDGQSVGFTLELPDCKNRNNVSRIPTGTYKTTVEPKHKKFGYCLRLHNVPKREGVIIHLGNYPMNTRGCILPGKDRETDRCTVSESRAALDQYKSIINSAADIETKIENNISSTNKKSKKKKRTDKEDSDWRYNPPDEVKRTIDEIQRIVGTKPDGIYGPHTRELVKKYQIKLKTAGLYTKTIDGKWGKNTERAHLALKKKRTKKKRAGKKLNSPSKIRINIPPRGSGGSTPGKDISSGGIRG